MLTVAERETAQQLLANGWKPAKTAHALLRARSRNVRAKQIGWLFGVSHLMGDEAENSQPRSVE